MTTEPGAAEKVASARSFAETQAGMISRRQLNERGVDRFLTRNQIAAGRWCERSPMVVSTTTGPLSRQQMMWLGVLHAGQAAVLGGLTAAELQGLRNWQRVEITVLIPDNLEVEPVRGISFKRTRRAISSMSTDREGLPVLRIEPAILLFGAYQRSCRTAQGVVAAAVQQRLTTADRLLAWIPQLTPLRWAPMFRQSLAEIAGGAHSVAELDVARACHAMGITKPDRQRKRLDPDGRRRWTDCEWDRPDGHVIVLEIDGSFHMEVQHWEDDLRRQRRLSGDGRTIVRCTARELREEPAVVGRDLCNLGVPRVA